MPTWKSIPKARRKRICRVLSSHPKLDVLIEETDAPYFKLKAREYARGAAFPSSWPPTTATATSPTSNATTSNPTLPLLHGILGDITADQFKNLSPQELPGVIAKMAGANLAVPRMLQSVPEVGKTIYSWPQLGTAANLCGTTLGYLARRVILKAPNVKNRPIRGEHGRYFRKRLSGVGRGQKKEFHGFRRQDARTATTMRINYRPWEISFGDFSKQTTTANRLKFLLRFAVLAPSSHNSQPWRFRIEGGSISIFAEASRRLKDSDKNDRQLFISLGCAVTNILIAADYYGMTGTVRPLPDGNDPYCAARIDFTTPQPKANETDLSDFCNSKKGQQPEQIFPAAAR